MKTAISMPDATFHEADRVARQLGLSRSQLYSRAVSEYIREHSRQGVREALDRVYAEEQAAVDPVLATMQINSLRAEEW